MAYTPTSPNQPVPAAASPAMTSPTPPTTPGEPVQSTRIPVPSTAVTAGTPGSFNNQVPANLAALQALGALGQTTAWTTGQYVVLGDASNANWTGSAWAAGIHA